MELPITDQAKTPVITSASAKRAKKPAVNPALVMIRPVTSGPVECPISIIDDNAPMDAPISSILARSATYALVVTVDREMPFYKNHIYSRRKKKEVRGWKILIILQIFETFH